MPYSRLSIDFVLVGTLVSLLFIGYAARATEAATLRTGSRVPLTFSNWFPTIGNTPVSVESPSGGANPNCITLRRKIQPAFVPSFDALEEKVTGPVALLAQLKSSLFG